MNTPQAAKPKTTPRSTKSGERPGFVRFVTRKGVTYDAWAYGYKAWPIGRRGTKRGR
jgi:hypothetical protein